MDAVADIKERLSVEDVVADYVELKPAGSNLKALSPFSQEKTPSLMVSPDKQIWHDFSSNKGGDMFSFVMEAEGVEFKEALEILARKAGLDLSRYQSGRGLGAEQRQKLERALSLATRFYQEQLIHNDEALTYITKTRRFNKQAIMDFGIGYAPNSGQALLQFLRKKGLQDTDITKAGLAVGRAGRLVDMFRGRVLVALCDRSGRPIGFTGRILGDEEGPKYINTAQTPLYEKSRHVFGIHMAKEAIRAKDLVVLAEGNLDVVSAHQAGFKHVVATAGTALTAEQLKQLKHLTHNVALAFDGDKAGLAATLRGIPLAQAQGLRLFIIELPLNQDPDEIIRRHAKNWQKLEDQRQYALDWLMDYYLKKFDVSAVEGKKDFVANMLEVLKTVVDPVEQEHYFGKIAEATHSSLSAVQRSFTALQLKLAKKPKITVVSLPVKAPRRQAVVINNLLALTLAYPDIRSVLGSLTSQYLMEEWQQVILSTLQKSRDTGPRLIDGDLKKYESFVKVLQLIAEERYWGWQKADALVEADQLALSLQKLQNLQNKSKLTEQIRIAEAAGDWAKAETLLASWDNTD